MNLYKISFLALLNFCFLAIGCSDGADNNDDGFETEDISFNVAMGDYTEVTRATSVTGWQAGDEIGSYMFATGTFSSIDDANVCYTASGEATKTIFTSTSPFNYPVDASKVDFMAYYPYKSDLESFIYPINLVNQSSGTTKYDLMRATSRTGYSIISSRSVTLEFSHCLSKVVFQFQDKNGVQLMPESMSLIGMNTTAIYDLESTVLQNEADMADIVLYASTSSYEAIVLPATITSTHMITFVYDNVSYSWLLEDNLSGVKSLVANNKYSFTITVPVSASGGGDDDDEVTGDVFVEGGIASPWDSENEGAGTASKIAYSLFPVNESTAAYADTELKLTFDSAPTIGTTGKVQIYKADGTLVDEIDMSDTQNQLVSGSTLNTKMDIIGVADTKNSQRLRVVNYNPLRVEGNTVIIKPHYNKLAYGTSYYVLVENGVINHSGFAGITEASKWKFTTKSAPSVPTDNAHMVTVSHEAGDNADFYSVQAAIDFLCVNVAKDTQKTIFIHNGTYEELLYMRGSNALTFKGESREGVVIQHYNIEALNNGVGGSFVISGDAAIGTAITQSGGRAVMLMESADKIRFETLTLKNTTTTSGQAEALYFNASGQKSLMFVNCNIISKQDTLCIKGYSWFYNCFIAGDVDFIWGTAEAALFENCEIRSVSNGYIVQARPAENAVGFVFLNCELTTTGTATYMYLARTAGNSSYFDNITFANCKMASVFSTTGWGLSGGQSGTAPNPSVPTLANGYKMYNTMDLNGNAVTVNTNYAAAYTLSDAEFQANFSSRGIILNGYDSAGAAWFAE